MQMLWNIIAQIKKDNCVKDHIEAVNSAFWCFDVINLFCCSEQPVCYSDKQNIHQQCWYDSNNINDSDDSADESVLDISDVF